MPPSRPPLGKVLRACSTGSDGTMLAAVGKPCPQRPAPCRPVSHYSYKNDILGRRTQIAQRGTAFQLLQLHGQNSIQVAYNDRGEVTNYQITSKAPPRSGDTPVAGQPEPKPTSLINQTYQFDAIGNRVRFASEDRGQKSEVSYQTNPLNQYTLIGEEGEKVRKGEGEPGDGRLSHDPDGNLLEDKQNRYTWSAENRLIKVESKDGSSKVEYTYDYQGRRTTKKQSTKNREPRTTIYLYDGWNLLAELESEGPRKTGVLARSPQPKQQSPPALKSKASSLTPDAKASSLKSPSVKTLTHFYTWGRDLSGTLQGAGGVGGLLAVTEKGTQKQADTHLYPCYDANGNIGQMISPKAEIKAAYQYDAFGRTVDQAGESAEENKWRFSTKPQEKQTGWYYYGFRYYDPETGRWPSRDPIEENGGVNLYEFVGNNGVSAHDVHGLCSAGDQLGIGFYWLIAGLAPNAQGQPQANILPWSCFDPDETYETYVKQLYISRHQEALNAQCHRELEPNTQGTLDFDTEIVVPAISPHAIINHYEFTAYPTEVTAQRFTAPGRTKCGCYIVLDLKYEAYDRADFNPGDRFGPGGALSDDWFIWLRDNTPIGHDHSLYSSSSGQLVMVGVD